MEYKSYRIQQEEKLEDLAKQIGISVEKLQELNPNMETFKNFWGTETFVAVNQVIRVPVRSKGQSYGNENFDFDFKKSQEERVAKLSEEERFLKSLTFDQQARYRCEQLNISRINNEIITLSANTYIEFLVKQSQVNKTIFEVSVQDLLFSVDPRVYEEAFKFGQKLEKIRFPIILGSSKQGVTEKIYNLSNLQNKWKKFRDSELKKDIIYQQLEKQNPNQAKDLILTGNKEFASEKIMSTTLDKNLFFHIFFRAIQGEDLPGYTLENFSQLFPQINLVTNVVKSKVKGDDFSTTYRLVGILDLEKLSDTNLKKMYDEIYKPFIKYSFTEFKTIYRITYSIENETNFLIEAKAILSEKIKNNFEVITEMRIKKVEL